MLTITPRPAPRLGTAPAQAIALLALPAGELTARLAVAAAENPALRLVPPSGGGWQGPVLDPEGLAAPGGSLIAHVLGQIGGLRLAPRAAAIALALAEALEPTGWLGRPPAAIARACGVPLPELEVVLAQLQRLEPAGIFARSLADCLRLQALAEGMLSAELAAVLDHLPQLAAGDLAGIAQASGLPVAGIAAAARHLRAFDPKPGLAFSHDMPLAPPPDLLLAPGPEGWAASMNPALLRVEVLADRPGRAAAEALRRALEGRNRMALAVGNALARRQADWLAGGAPAAVTTREVAAETGISISSVNRCLAAVVARSPLGTLPLRALLTPPAGAEGVAAAQVRLRLAELLRSADPAGTSDAKLAAQLAQEGMPIARRTVAKYRAQLR